MRYFAVLIAAALLALAGCQNMFMISCRTTDLIGGHASCSGSIEQLDHEQYIELNVGDLSMGASVRAQVTVTTTGGRAQVSYQNNDLRTISGEVGVNQPYTLDDRLYVVYTMEETTVRLTFKPLDGTATGINFTAEFDR